ncbi:MAG TPA: DNA translocase FtsK 4TM domain-containing protein [Bacteroidia bacterium]|nr:DNA translocase FtsK 4TM domain-containing protein [Bacteroidia bacterium]
MAPKGNRFKEEVIEEQTEKSASKKTKTREKTTGRKSSPEPSAIARKLDLLRNLLNNEKFHKISGLFLILVSLLLLVSFTSFFFTWKADHDKVTGSLFDLLMRPDVKVDNWFGKIGAISADRFINQWFGISAFSLVLISFLSGFRILFGSYLLPMNKVLKYSVFGFLFLSASLAYALGNTGNLLFLAGGFGFEMNTWLHSFLGSVGTGLFLGFTLIGFLVSVFNFNFKTAFTGRPESGDVDLALAELAGEQSGNHIKENVVTTDSDASEKTRGSLVLELGNEDLASERDQTDSTNEDEIEFSLGDQKVPVPVASTELTSDPVLSVDLPEDDGNDDGIPLAIEQLLSDSDAENEASFEPGSVEVLGEYDPTLDLSSYQFPTLDLLENHSSVRNQHSREELIAELEANKNKIVETLGHYNIAIDKIKATVGPTVTLFEIIPQAGIRISKIKNLEDDIALSLSALGIRIIAPIPGKGTIGIEVPNQYPEVVSMRSVIASEKFQNTEYDLPVALGKTISNEVFITDLAKMPHLLMAGATGQGKSVGLNAVLVSLLYKKHPSQVKFVLVDPKKVELTLFKTIERHFLAKLPGDEDAIITDTRKVINTLNSLCIEMDQRYELLKDAQVRNIREYNVKFVNRRLNPKNGHRFLPFIVLVIDEFADLIMTAGKEVETPIARLAQLARAIGIHLIIATQRPSVNIITGTIKANFPARLAFRVTSKIDSRTILDTGGADQLIGRGDMLFATGADLIRLQCAFVDTPEVDQITEYIGSQRGYPEAFQLPEYVGEEGSSAGDYDASERDPLFEDAARMVVQHQQGSASLLQRRLKLGYNRAGRIIDQLEAAGIIGQFEGSKAREVKIKDAIALEQFLSVGNKQ